MDSFLPHIGAGDRHLVYENRYQQIYQVRAVLDGLNKEYFVMNAGRRFTLPNQQQRLCFVAGASERF